MQIKTTQIAEYREKLLKRQKDTCPLCGCKLSVNLPSLDHDHDTGIIRDVLCRNCNQVEGRVNAWVHRGKRQLQKIHYLQRLLAYWERHELDQTGLIHPSHGKTKSKKRKRRKTKVTSRAGLKSGSKTTGKQ